MEAARLAEGLTVKQAMKLLGLSRTSYYRQVRGMRITERGREVASAKHIEVLREVAINEWKGVVVECEPTPWLGESCRKRRGAAG